MVYCVVMLANVMHYILLVIMECLHCIQIADMYFIYIARSYQLKCTHSKKSHVVFFAQIEAISHRHEMTLKVCCIKRVYPGSHWRSRKIQIFKPDSCNSHSHPDWFKVCWLKERRDLQYELRRQKARDLVKWPTHSKNLDRLRCTRDMQTYKCNTNATWAQLTVARGFKN